MSSIDPARANSVASSLAQNLKTVNDSMNTANAGTSQAAAMASVLQTVVQNPDLFSQGGPSVDKLTNDITLLNADMRDGDSSTGGASQSFNKDWKSFIGDLNNSGMQVDFNAGQGHYDSTTIKAPDADATSAASSPAAAPQNPASALSADDIAAAPQSVQDAAKATGAQVYKSGTNYNVVVPGNDTTQATVQAFGVDGNKQTDPTAIAANSSKTMDGGINYSVNYQANAQGQVSASIVKPENESPNV